MFNLKKKNFMKIDVPLLICTLILCVFGLIVLKSATISITNRNFMTSQMIATLLGFIMIVFVLLIDYDFVKDLYIPIYLVSLFLLLFVLLFGTGLEEWGAKSWIHIGPINFQPSEFVKIGLILSLAKLLESKYKKINQPLTLLFILFVAFAPVFLIARQPDFGTASVVIFIIAVMLFSVGLSYKYILGTIVALVSVSPIFYASLDEFQKNRILNFLDPTRDLADTGFQAMQGRIAIGSGQFWGRGLFQGVQTQNNFIPEKQTDFIYAVLGEELGFLGAALLIFLYAYMLYRMIVIAKNAKDVYGMTVSLGVAAMFLFHIFENIGMTLGLLPITGIPLPFFSYGGTYQIINLIAIGLVLAVSIEREPLDFSNY